MKMQAVKAEGTVFGAEYNESLIHEVIVAYQAESRQGTRAQKNRSAVSGGGAKPFRQKGTGRARAGTTRGPIWVGGGRAFPNKPDENFSKKVNRKAYKIAMRSILSELARQERLVISDDLSPKEPKTKLLSDSLDKAELNDVLVITHEIDTNLDLASRNLYRIGLMEVCDINPYSLVGFDKVLLTSEAAKQIEEKFQ